MKIVITHLFADENNLLFVYHISCFIFTMKTLWKSQNNIYSTSWESMWFSFLWVLLTYEVLLSKMCNCSCKKHAHLLCLLCFKCCARCQRFTLRLKLTLSLNRMSVFFGGMPLSPKTNAILILRSTLAKCALKA